MIICHSHRFILFCNPGTGTGPLLRHLAPWAEEEVVAWRDRRKDRPFYFLMSPVEAEWTFDAIGLPFRTYRRITLVMDPFTRLQGLYRRIAETDRLWQMRRGSGLGQPSFADWLRSTRPDGRGAGGRAHERWRRYGSWSAEHWCGDRINDAVRTETMHRDLPPILADLGVNTGDLPLPTADPADDWQTTYDGASATLVGRRYAADLARFDYDHPALHWAA